MRKWKTPSPPLVISCLALAIALGGTAYAASLPKNSVGSPQVRNGSLQVADLGKKAQTQLMKPRGYASIQIVGVIGATIYWDMKIVGPSRGFAYARTPEGGVTCLKPKRGVLTKADVFRGVLTDSSGNDTRAYFNGSFGCNANEVRVVQKANTTDTPTNQAFNIIVP